MLYDSISMKFKTGKSTVVMQNSGYLQGVEYLLEEDKKESASCPYFFLDLGNNCTGTNICKNCTLKRFVHFAICMLDINKKTKIVSQKVNI